MMPIVKLIANLSSVVFESWDIKKKQQSMEIMGITGTRGHLKFLCKSGRWRRRIITDSARKMNAESVPILTSSITTASGINAAINAPTVPTSIILVTGDLNDG